MPTNNNALTGITLNLASAGFVAGTTSTYTTTVTTAGLINGKFITTLGAQTNTASPTTDANTGLAFVALQPNQCCVLLWGTNAAGAIKLCQGPILATLVGVTTTVGALLNDPQFPSMPDDFCPMAYTVVRTAPSAAAWTPGTGTWTASGVSATTFANIGQLPNRPQAS
jgi:hypothetical protein